jgi:Flp pilus assembly protein TadG
VAVAVAVLLPVLIGFAGIGIEVGLWFAVYRQNQSAADAAAISAGLEYAAQIQRGVATDPAAATAAAITAANCNLFSTSSSSSNPVCPWPSSASNTITLTTSGSSGTPSAVQVVLTQPLNTTFANLVTAIWGPNVPTVYVTTSAIAAFPTAGTACYLALDASAPNAFLVDNGGTLPNSNCWAASNSSSGSALNCNGCTIAGPTNVVGGDAVSNGGQLNGSPNRTYASAIADPYANVPLGSAGPCLPAVTTGSQTPIPPGHYCDGIKVADGSPLTMSPGVYYVDKGFNISNGSRLFANLPGGVTIIINDPPYCIGDGTCQAGHGIGADSTLNIIAPTTGPFAGIAIFGPRDSSPAKVQEFVAGSQINIQGAIYFPSQTILFDPSSQLNPSFCTQIIGDMIHIQTNASISNSCGGAGVGSISILQVYLAS